MQSRLAELPAARAATLEPLARLPAFAAAKSVAAYVSKDSEIQTHTLIRQLLAAGRQVSVPVFSGKHYRLAQLRDFDADLRPGHWGILEPKIVTPPAREPDVWLVPGLAFDVKGNRLGRGLGYFDRLLERAGGVKIALAYDFQILKEVPVKAHDVQMDFIVTETQIINCRRQRA